MCGLVGVAGVITDKQEKAYRQLLILDTLRGTDSTGTAFIAEDGTADVVKTVGHAFELLDYLPHTRRFARKNVALIGHNRSATIGNISKMNAHPFEFDNIVGAHNGTLMNKHELPNGYTYNVDSQALFGTMDVLGVHETVKKLRGAWALTWWDKRNKTINLLRNKERPLWYGITQFNNTLFWASEPWMLEIACGRNDIKLEDITKVEEDTLYSFSFDSKTGLVMAKEEGLKGAPPFCNNATTGPVGGTRARTTASPSFEQRAAEALKATVHALPGMTGWVVGLFGTKQLEVLCQLVERDEKGAVYVSCSSDKYPHSEFRLYLNKKDGDPARYINRRILGDVGKYHQGRARSYYKLDHSTHKWALTPERPEIEEETYEDSSGNKVSFQDWMKKHGTCSYCSSVIYPAEGFGFSKSSTGEVLCSECCADPELRPYVNVKG